MTWLWLVLLAPPAWLLISSIASFLRNYAIARKVGLPTFFVPISPENPLWIMMGRHIVPWAKYVPFGSGSFSRFGYTGWEWTDKYQAPLEHGGAIMLVSPGKNWIYVSDAETIHDIIQRERRRDFERPVELLGAFGARRKCFGIVLMAR